MVQISERDTQSSLIKKTRSREKNHDSWFRLWNGIGADVGVFRLDCKDDCDLNMGLRQSSTVFLAQSRAKVNYFLFV